MIVASMELAQELQSYELQVRILRDLREQKTITGLDEKHFLRNRSLGHDGKTRIKMDLGRFVTALMPSHTHGAVLPMRYLTLTPQANRLGTTLNHSLCTTSLLSLFIV